MTQGTTKGVPIDTDATMALNSNQVVPSQAAVVTYVGAKVAAGALPATATNQQILLSQNSASPIWSTSTYPTTNAANTLLYASAANVMSALATANSSVLVTNGTGVPSLSTTLPTGIAATNMNLTTPTLGAATATSIVFNPTTGGIIGTTTNDNASAGKVGEYLFTSFVTGQAITSNTVIQVATLALTAGDWDVWGMISTAVGAGTITAQLIAQIGTTSATLSSATSQATSARSDLNAPSAASTVASLQTGVLRVSLSATTDYYLNAYAFYSVSTLTLGGILNARRVR